MITVCSYGSHWTLAVDFWQLPRTRIFNSGNIVGFMPPGSLGNTPLTASGRGIHIELRFIGIDLNCRQKEVEEKPIAIYLRDRLFGTV